MLKYLVSIFCIVIVLGLSTKNPIIPDKGTNDTHIRIIDGKANSSAFDFSNGKDKLSPCFRLKGKGHELLRFDSIRFQ